MNWRAEKDGRRGKSQQLLLSAMFNRIHHSLGFIYTITREKYSRYHIHCLSDGVGRIERARPPKHFP